MDVQVIHRCIEGIYLFYSVCCIHFDRSIGSRGYLTMSEKLLRSPRIILGSGGPRDRDVAINYFFP